ncbi:hypothetical protein HOK51_02415 [Candidatus Woesearchaeota archaeon]|jgi:hypothetical protein|nr:hypothetical protein [Candidatus Woesearchaeota archaeon]MBT6518671.1 hypothetical protein [Candidatus Woesearchaeota archaeon]MBT7368861.1 hypothetical protein [Candidatus Woesearchaeota archaeon]
MTLNLVNKKVVNFFIVFLILFGLLIVYQIIKKMLGGSWSVEELVISLLVLNLGSTFTVGIMIAQNNSDLKYLKQQFSSLARDFKIHLRKEH